MALGQVPIRERLLLPKREGVPLAHVLQGAGVFPADTEAYLYLYDVEGEELAFWPLVVEGDTVSIDVTGAEWWPYRNDARSFTVFVIYAAEPTKSWPWFEGAVLRAA